MRGKEIARKRVAAYCRVSTYGEEQLNSFSSQVECYTELIEKETMTVNKEERYLIKLRRSLLKEVNVVQMPG